jgi:CheY-like chemotaxis protein
MRRRPGGRRRGGRGCDTAVVSAFPDFPDPADPPARAVVRLIDLEPDVTGLVAEWLAAAGHAVAADDGTAPAAIVVDVPFPRRDGAARVQALKAAWPRTPILVVSATLLGSVAACGAVAHELGVAGVLSAPLRREALLAALARALGR